MRQRSLLSFLAAALIVLLLINITGCNGFAKSPLSSITNIGQPGAAIFVSKQAPAMVSMLVNPDRLQARVSEEQLSKLKTSLFANTGIDYRQDVQPWLGNEITLAVTSLDIDRDPGNGQKPGYLMVLATDKPEKSREFVDLLFSQRALAGAVLAVEQYKGVKLIYDNKRQNSLVGAVVGDRFVLFANDPKVLREAINNVQATDLNLTSSSQYQQATKQLPKGAMAVAFLNLPTVAQWQGLELPVQTYGCQIISLVLNPKGLLVETTALAREETLPLSPQLSQPVGALQYIPSSADLAVSGSNLSSLGNSDLAQFWRQLTAAISGSEEDVISKLLADSEKRWGINLREDIFSWVQGEYAMGLLPGSEQTIPDWILVAQKSEATPAAISRLDAIASSGGLSLTSLSLGKQQISAWTQLTTATTKSDAKDRESFTIQAKVLGAHTTVGNYEIFTNSIEAMVKALTAKENSLIDNRNFQDSIAAIPQPNLGYVYLDWKKSQEILEGQLPILKLVVGLGKPFFQNLRSLTVSSYGSERGLLKGGVFFQVD